MLPRQRRKSLKNILFASSLLIVVPTTLTAADELVPSPQASVQAPMGRRVFRPPFPLPRAKALYPSGYAGASYLPGSTSRPLSPTGYWTRPGRPFSRFLRHR